MKIRWHYDRIALLVVIIFMAGMLFGGYCCKCSMEETERIKQIQMTYPGDMELERGD